jgi:tetratricopeptide (TPR) repeat protein
LARLTRHEILKEDRFMMLVEELRHFFANNRSEILRGLSAAGVVGLLVAGFYYYTAKQEEHSKEELARALATYHATVGQAESSGATAPFFFTTSAEKYEKALSALQEVVSRHDSRAAGKIATYYSGLCLHQLDRSSEAVLLLEPLSQEQSDFGALALAALGRIYEDSADIAKATEVYRQLVDRNALTTPGQTLAMHMALLYERQNKQEQAAKMYEKVINDFPTSPASTEAEQRLRKIVP